VRCAVRARSGHGSGRLDSEGEPASRGGTALEAVAARRSVKKERKRIEKWKHMALF